MKFNYRMCQILPLHPDFKALRASNLTDILSNYMARKRCYSKENISEASF